MSTAPHLEATPATPIEGAARATKKLSAEEFFTDIDNLKLMGSLAFAGSQLQYESSLARLTEFDFETQDYFIDMIGAGLRAKELSDEEPEELEDYRLGEFAKEQLVLSFAARVVNMAHWNANRVGLRRPTFIEETTQIGMATLAGAIITYAELPREERHALWAYLQSAVERKLREATRDELLGKRVSRTEITDSLGRYRRTCNEWRLQHDRQPTDQEVADAMKLTLEQVYGLRMWATPTRTYASGQFEELEGEYFTTQEPDNAKAVALVERALEFLGDTQQRMMRMRFGMGDELQLTASEIAEALDMNDTAVSFAFGRDLAALKGYITGLQNDTLDYEQLRVKKSIRNSLMLLRFANITPPETARLPELRQMAIAAIRDVVFEEREWTVMYGLYGLEDGKRLMHKELAEKLGMSKSNVRNVESRVLERLKLITENDEPGPVQTQ